MNNVWKKDTEYRRRRMIISRITGLLTCIAALAAIAVYYFNIINHWLCIIILAYCLGTIFSSNSFLQDIKVGNPWQRINGITSILFFLLAVALIIWGFVTKELVLQF